MLSKGEAENVEYNFRSRTDTKVVLVGSHVWVEVLQLPTFSASPDTQVHREAHATSYRARHAYLLPVSTGHGNW